jgi:uncharacterized protein (TIGR02266 family)
MAEPIDKDTRGPVNLRIKFRSESLQQFIERYGVDVSRGGIFIRTREPLPVGTRLKLDFQLVDTAPLFQGDGTVVWIREHDASRAGVTPGMGVRFDRLTSESQTTLDTILEEKIRLQQSGVAPGSIAKAGAGMAVRRPSGAFATLDAQTARPSGPPPLPVEVKMDTPIAPSINLPPPIHAAPAMGAAPAAPMPASSSRSGPLAAGPGSNSIFNRPRTTSGMRAVPVPSQLFEAPTAADIDKALSVLEEKGGAPALPIVPTVIKPESSMPIGEDDPTRVFDASSEFAASEAITGKGEVLPETGIPIETGETGGDGELTERRLVDPASGKEKREDALSAAAKADGKAMGLKAEMPPPVPKTGSGRPATLDAPLSTLLDSGKAPPLKAPPLMTPAAAKKAAEAAAAAAKAIPKRITTDRPAAMESGRFRSDARYKRKRGNGLYWAIAIVVLGAGAFGGFKYIKRERDKRVAAALAAAAASPPLAAGQEVPQPPAGSTIPPGAGGAAASPTETGAGPTEAPDKAAAKPAGTEEAAVKTEKAGKPEKQNVGKPAEKAIAGAEKPARPEDGASPKPRKKERPAGGATETAAKTEKPAETKPADEAKGGSETAKPADGEKTEKTAEAAKPPETPPPPAAPPVLKITSSPSGAEVTIDGVPAGVTPFSSKEVEPGGTHTISLKKEGFEPQERMISGSDWSRGKGGVQSLKFNIKLKRAGGEAKPPAEPVEKKPEVEILTPSEP